jgi:hypothetical protein
VHDGRVRPVGEFSPMLGAHDACDWSRTSVELEPGDVLVLHTDGVFDTAGGGARLAPRRRRAPTMTSALQPRGLAHARAVAAGASPATTGPACGSSARSRLPADRLARGAAGRANYVDGNDCC